MAHETLKETFTWGEFTLRDEMVSSCESMEKISARVPDVMQVCIFM